MTPKEEVDKLLPCPFTPTNLPVFKDCRSKVLNDEYRTKHQHIKIVEEIPTELERFIYEYTDTDPIRDHAFRERLANTLNEVSRSPSRIEAIVMQTIEAYEKMWGPRTIDLDRQQIVAQILKEYACIR